MTGPATSSRARDAGADVGVGAGVRMRGRAGVWEARQWRLPLRLPSRPRARAAGYACSAAVAAGLLLPCPAAARSAFQARCEAAAAGATATIAAQENGWRIDNSLSFRALTAMKRPRVAEGYVLGLTHTESRVSVRVDGKLLADPATGVECLLPRVAVTLSYLPIVVYVSRELAPGTCAYREVLAHEMRHLKSYQAYLPTVQERVREKLAKRYAGKPLYARAGEARALLQGEIDGAWLPTLRNEMARVERMQLDIDTAQEYARLSKVCHGEVQSLIASTRRHT